MSLTEKLGSIVALAALFCAGLNFPWYGRAFAALVALASGMFVFRKRSWLPRRDFQPTNAEPAQSYEERRRSILQAATRLSISEAELRLFSFLLLYPQLTRKRVNEHIELQSDPITKSSSMSLGVPQQLLKKTEIAYLPIVRPVKGRHIMNLEVSDGQSGRMQTLNHEESVVLLARLADALLRKACAIPPKAQLTDGEGSVLAHFVEVLLRVPRGDLVTTKARKEVRDLAVSQLNQLGMTQLGITQEDIRKSTKWRELVSLISFVSCNYVVVGIGTPADRLSVQYRYELMRCVNLHEAKESSRANPNKAGVNRLQRWVDTGRGLARRLARTEASRVRVSVNKGNSCESYHLSLVVPECAHVAGITLTDAAGQPIERPEPPGHDQSQGYFRVGGKSTATAHLYARGLLKCHASNNGPAVSPGAAHLELSILETPPGALARAVLAASITTILVYLVGVRAESTASLNIDTFALLGGTAGICLTLIVFVRGGIESKIRVVALLALLSLLFTIAIIISSAVLLALGVESPEMVVPFQGSQIRPLSFFSIKSLAWYLCCMAALLNFVWSATALFIRMRRFDRLAARETRRVDTDRVEDILKMPSLEGAA